VSKPSDRLPLFAFIDNRRGLCYSNTPMLMIRLQRVGRTNDPSFRLVVTDKQNGPQSGKFLEVLGSYNARFGKAELKSERIKHWLTHGAQPSDTAKNILISHKLMEGDKTTFANKPQKIVEVAPVVEQKEEKPTEEVSTEREEETTTEPETIPTELVLPEEVPEEKKD